MLHLKSQNENVVKTSLPFWIAGAGIVASVIELFFVRCDSGTTQKYLLFALHKRTLVELFIVTGISAAICEMFFDNEAEGWKIFGCIVIGLASGVIIDQAT